MSDPRLNFDVTMNTRQAEESVGGLSSVFKGFVVTAGDIFRAFEGIKDHLADGYKRNPQLHRKKLKR
jgi:hypothetical protein